MHWRDALQGLEPFQSLEREFFIDNLLVRTHFIIVMIRWTGLAPWKLDFPFSGSLTSTFLVAGGEHLKDVDEERDDVRVELHTRQMSFSTHESGPLRAVHLSRRKWPGGLVN